MRYKLFLDDTRNPMDVYNKTNNNIYLEKDWFIIKKYDDFVNIVRELGVPNIISFTVDINNSHQNNSKRIGTDGALWLTKYCFKQGIHPPKYMYLHSDSEINEFGDVFHREYIKLFKKFRKYDIEKRKNRK